MSEMPIKLTVTEAAERLLRLKEGWDFHEGKLHRWFNFKDFKAAMEFVNQIAKAAEAVGHHPDIHIHYNKVLIELFTHDIHGLSKKDFEAAKAIDEIIT
jgi:4a-hydroxytetrahydrobiopterin dehydratase